MSSDRKNTVEMIVNEQLKLKATFWNNLAVATTAAGVFIPIYAASRDPAMFNAPIASVVTQSQLITGGAALLIAAAMRKYSGYLLTKLRFS